MDGEILIMHKQNKFLSTLINSMLQLLLSSLTIYHTMMTFEASAENDFWKHCGKEENAGNQHFLLFPQCFLHYKKKLCVFF